MTTAEHITPDLEQALAGTGLVLEDVTVTPAGKRRVVKVLLDRDLGDVESATERIEPLSLDEVADAARLVGGALDRSGALGEQPYTLEVSSPGVGRPLTEPRHFRRNVGRLVTARHEGVDVTGRVTAADATTVTLDLPATRTTPARRETLPYAGIERAVVEVEFARPDESRES